MSTETKNPNIHMLWPTPLLRKKFEQHEAVNAELVKLFYQHKSNDTHAVADAPIYSSSDDLLMRYDNAALNQLFAFISQSVFEISSQMNAEIWKHSQSKKMNMEVVGAWFQIQNGHGYHETHTHGNCAWSGVYYVQVDDDEKRESNKALGARNGITRFYSHQMDVIGGGYMDSGNLYLQNTAFDSKPQEGVLCVFPSHLKHMAMPYIGDKDRIIISFNAQVHGDQGDGVFNYSFY
ncbi:MAG: 2OG-Fe(II) oxygenase family protein [Gammaproteobacteria bacterium]|nr:2OG-Fe(II) oxygenase family protein [Gammaproteobacteria bacterium]